MSAGDGAVVGRVDDGDHRPSWLSLDPDETVEWVGKPAFVSVAPALLVGVLFIPLLGVGLLVIAGTVLSVKNTDYVATSRSLYVKRGILSTNIESVGLDKIQNTEYRQSFLGKQFDYGSIDVSTAGSSGAEITFRAVPDARDVRELVNRLTNQARERPETDAPGERTDEAWVEDLLAELTATREALENVERALRAERTGPTWDEAEETAGAGPNGDVSETDDLE